jgi:uncharacterized membrane protein YfcA
MIEHASLFVYIFLVVVALVAGFIDTLSGGGGLITLPAMLFTGMNPIAALGTNKLQSAIGEFSATLHFLRKSKVNYRILTMAFVYTIIGSSIGTALLQITPTDKLEKAIPFFLLAVLIYYVFSLNRKNEFYNQTLEPNNKKFLALGSSIGFYNGFFGPGTGSIWALALMKCFKLDLQKATMYAKPLNLAGNLTALSIFIVGGRVDYLAAILMGIGSFAGGKLGANFVMYKDVKFLKIIFLLFITLSTLGTFVKYYW